MNTDAATELDQRKKLLDRTVHIRTHRTREVDEHHHTVALALRQSRQATEDVFGIAV